MQFLAVQAGIALWLMQLNINHTHCVSGEDPFLAGVFPVLAPKLIFIAHSLANSARLMRKLSRQTTSETA